MPIKKRTSINNNKKDEIAYKKNQDKISQILGVPEGTFKNFPTIQIRGNREITIDGCMGLLTYEENKVVLETRYCNINITGKYLTLHHLTNNILAIRGFIKNVEFSM